MVRVLVIAAIALTTWALLSAIGLIWGITGQALTVAVLLLVAVIAHGLGILKTEESLEDAR